MGDTEGRWDAIWSDSQQFYCGGESGQSSKVVVVGRDGMIRQQSVLVGGLKIGGTVLSVVVFFSFLMHFPQCNSLTFCVMLENKGFSASMFMQFCQLSRGTEIKKVLGEWRTCPARVPLKIGSKLTIPALLASAKLCLCSPFQGTPGVLASIWCAQNALRCHLFKHSEPLANRDKPLFIKPLILAARMTT